MSNSTAQALVLIVALASLTSCVGSMAGCMQNRDRLEHEAQMYRLAHPEAR